MFFNESIYRLLCAFQLPDNLRTIACLFLMYPITLPGEVIEMKDMNSGISRRLLTSVLISLGILLTNQFANAADPPRIEQKDGRYALMVDGHPFLILGGQI